MVSTKDISRFADRIVQEFSPDRIVLFGSYAGGEPTDDSDVDILVIMRHGKKRNVEQAIDITRRIDRSFSLDLIVRTPAETRRRLKQHDMFLSSVIEKGRTLYATDRRRMD